MPSSSSSAPDPKPFAWFLDRSLSTLREEMTPAYDRLVQEIRGRTVRLWVDAEPDHVLEESGSIRVVSAPLSFDVEFRASRPVLKALVGGRLTFLDGLLRDRIHLQGSIEDLLVFHDALQTYLRGAVRCPSLPGLLGEFEASTEPPP